MTPGPASSGTILSQGRAAVYEEPIGPDGVRIRERPRTEAAPGTVAVTIRAASINHLDLWLAHGAQRITPPRVIAADGAGVVQSSGDAAGRPFLDGGRGLPAHLPHGLAHAHDARSAAARRDSAGGRCGSRRGGRRHR